MTAKRLIIILLLLTAAISSSAQTIDDLRANIARAEAEIKATNLLLSKTQTSQKSSQGQLNLIRNRINNRKKIISNLQSQITLITKNIKSKNGTVMQLESDLDRLKKEYAAMVYNAYKNYKLNNFIVFLFASKDFNDATRRISYMRRYNQMREVKALEIDTVTSTIGREIEGLQVQKDELGAVKTSQANELASLSMDEKQYKNEVVKYQREASKLNTQIKAKQKEINGLQTRIQQIIAEEAKKNKAQPKSAAEQEYIANLSGKFDQNRGLLPYPVRGGVIVERYGTHPHPTQKGLVWDNKGVNIAAAKGSDVRAVFEGDVTRIFFFQGLQNSIMIRHGNYLTVYSNLEKVSVKVGDKVSINQTIGRLTESNDSDDYVLHFEIWNGTTNLNPEPWIKR